MMWDLLTETGFGSCMVLAAGLWVVLAVTLGKDQER